MLLVLYTGQRDIACPVYRTGRCCLSCISVYRTGIYFIMLVPRLSCTYRSERSCLSCIQDRQILVVLYTGQRDIACHVYMSGRYFIVLVLQLYIVHKFIGQRGLACPVYRTQRYCLPCIKDREILLILYYIQDREMLHFLHTGRQLKAPRWGMPLLSGK